MMKLRAGLTTCLLLVSVLCWPHLASAAPPSEEALQRDPDSELNFLSEQEYRRIARTEPISVPTQVVLGSPFPTRLANACRDLGELEEREFNVKSELDLEQVLATTDGLFSQLQRLSSSSSNEEILDAARQLATIDDGITEVCDHIDGLRGGLTVADVELLRVVFEDDALRLTQMVEVLKKSNVELLNVLTAPDGEEFEQAKAAFLDVVELGEPGTPQSMGSLSSLGGAAETAFEGLAQFLIDRAKEEAIAFVREQLTQAICRSDPGLFIPKTCKVLETADANMSLSAMGSSLNTALISDLEWLPDRLLVLVGERAPEAGYASSVIRVLLALTRDARQHGDPLDFIVSLHRIDEIDCEQGVPALGSGDAACADAMAMLRLASSLAYSIISQERDLNDNFKSLGVAFALERRVDDLPLSARRRLATMLPVMSRSGDLTLRFDPVHLSVIHRTIVDSVVIVQSLQDQIGQLANGGDQGPSTQDILSTAAVAAVGLANIGLDIIELIELAPAQGGAAALAPVAPAAPVALLASAQVSRPALAFAAPADATEASAADALTTKLSALRPLLEDASKYFALAEGLSERDWSKAAAATLEVVVELLDEHSEASEGGISMGKELDVQLDNLRRYLPMFIEIANAKSSDEVAAALGSAFPAGSYKLKYRQSAVSVNAFVGAYGGGLYGTALNNDATTTTGLVNGEFALAAPVGVHITAPVGVHRQRPWHLGGMISVIDVGGITTAKWVAQSNVIEDTSDGGTLETAVGEPSNFNLIGIVSPGAYLTIGVSNSPFVMGLGASYSPFSHQLSTTTKDSNGDVTDSSEQYLGTLRFGAFLAVDITLVGFGLRGKK